MEKRDFKWITGRIIIVQEERFRLVGETGKGYLFDLFHSSGIQGEDLQYWKNRNVPVAVGYKGEPNLSSGIAHRVAPLPRKRRRQGNRQG